MNFADFYKYENHSFIHSFIRTHLFYFICDLIIFIICIFEVESCWQHKLRFTQKLHAELGRLLRFDPLLTFSKLNQARSYPEVDPDPYLDNSFEDIGYSFTCCHPPGSSGGTCGLETALIRAPASRPCLSHQHTPQQ